MKNQKNEIFIIRLIKTVRLKTLILLIILLCFNSYAWFVFATRVSEGMSAHIASWNVKFKAGDDEITTNIVFDVKEIYPGVQKDKTLTAYNDGEMVANLSYEIESARILDETYVKSDDLTSEQIEEILKTYPFKITFSIDNTNLTAKNGSANFTAALNWEFDSGNDELDTYWGEKAYEYNRAHPGEASIHIVILIRANQTEKGT